MEQQTYLEVKKRLREMSDGAIGFLHSHCWNDFKSVNRSYIFTTININGPLRSRSYNILRQNLLLLKWKRNLDQAARYLAPRLGEIYTIDVLPLKVTSTGVVLELALLYNKALAENFVKPSTGTLPSWHAKLIQPPYLRNLSGGKFDANWQLGTSEYLQQLKLWKKGIDSDQ